MHTSKIGFIDCSGQISTLANFLDTTEFDLNHSIHKDNYDEEELWVEVDNEKILLDVLFHNGYLREDERQEAKDLDYIIFY